VTRPSTASAASLPATSRDGEAGDRCACSSVPPFTSSAIPPAPDTEVMYAMLAPNSAGRVSASTGTTMCPPPMKNWIER
jgi:hypothetical protein